MNIIHGDLPVSPGLAGGDFVMAEVTDTRLMGVVGLHVERRNDMGSLHQLFYLDMEEFGFDDYRFFQFYENQMKNPGVIWTIEDVEREMLELFGGLGGTWYKITERESIYLLQQAARLNYVYESDFPDYMEKYAPLLESSVTLSEEENIHLWNTMTVEMKNDYMIVNYYIMRLVALDQEGADFFTTEEGIYDSFNISEPSTFYKNEIEPIDRNKNSLSLIHDYRSTSLIEDDEGFRLAVSEISITGPKVTAFKIIQDMRISQWEASTILAQEEYVSVLNPGHSNDAAKIIQILRDTYPAAEIHEHGSGILFMLFRDNNDHVGRDRYRLDDDVKVSIYVRYTGEVSIAGHQLEEVYDFEKRLVYLGVVENVVLSQGGRYSFPSLTLGHYVANDYGVFQNFLEFIQFLTTKDS